MTNTTTSTNNITSLKKKYSYYKRILTNKGSLTEAQQQTFNSIIASLGDNIPKQRQSKLTDEQRKANRREYYNKHKEQLKQYSKEWNKNNRAKVAEYNKRSYEKKKNNNANSTTLTESDFNITDSTQ